MQIDSTVQTTFSELYIPARILPYGIYELKLTVTMTSSSMFNSSSSAYVQIIPSGITANLVPYGTSMITRGYEQDLILDPGTYSIDPDRNIFNATVSSPCFIFLSSSSFSIRIGYTNITVESMAILFFPIATVRCLPLMIRPWIQSIHHVSPIEQVGLRILLPVLRYIHG